MDQRPKVGVAAVIHDKAGKIVIGTRTGSHGAGTMQFPGGHLEYGESFAECAKREVLEETGLEVGDIRFLVTTNDVFEDEGKHYVTVFMTCVVEGDKNKPEAMEPHKCARWDWVAWSTLWNWAKAQAEAEREGSEVKAKMFLPIVNLYRDYPDLEHCL
ncbi:hypothetical protein K469DRAFT_714615 [Zopfia rhizophila CBS 207.26]|uniref:Nudix hydrolase domain-containing protein n=1 Tax=Zopfia rhizophila CBS 207.26 TaxID=1314779 RepID=A0A6A6DM57_9PEZI|nr:hypothetical protein K469DRAFT_714615 [Zopfia rhizophila CBS 207.26]